MTLHLQDAVLLFGVKKNTSKKGKDLEANLVHQSGNGVLESLRDAQQSNKVMSLVEIDNTFSADSSLVSFAV